MSDAPSTLEALIDGHRSRLRGWVRMRVRDPHAADDVEQDTWLEVLRHGATFDASKGSFWTFTLIWARTVLKRHRGERRPDELELEPVDRAAAPDERLALARAAYAMLLLALQSQRPPHEVIALGFVRLGWKPEDLVTHLIDVPLDELLPRLERELAELLSLVAVRAALAALRARLRQPLEALISDPRTRRTYAHVLTPPAGRTCFADYLPAGTDPRPLVTRWWHSVLRSVLETVQRESDGDLIEWLR